METNYLGSSLDDNDGSWASTTKAEKRPPEVAKNAMSRGKKIAIGVGVAVGLTALALIVLGLYAHFGHNKALNSAEAKMVSSLDHFGKSMSKWIVSGSKSFAHAMSSKIPAWTLVATGVGAVGLGLGIFFFKNKKKTSTQNLRFEGFEDTDNITKKERKLFGMKWSKKKIILGAAILGALVIAGALLGLYFTHHNAVDHWMSKSLLPGLKNAVTSYKVPAWSIPVAAVGGIATGALGIKALQKIRGKKNLYTRLI